MLDIPTWAWAATLGFVVALFVLDFLLVARRPHEVGLREAAIESAIYIGIAIAFGAVVWVTLGHDAGTQYYAGWLVEKSLSVDNLFVFVIIMTQFAVPKENQQKVLLFGIAVALVMRGIFIAIGAAAISAFSWTFVIFGLFLIYTAVQLARHKDEEPDPTNNKVLALARRYLPATEEYDGDRLITKVAGKRLVTPLFLVFITIGSVDLLFALDSIPAIFGITQEPYLVFTANAFALLGLRALYFLVAGLLQRLVYLSIGLSLILAFIGVKLILLFLHEDVSTSFPEVPTVASLGVVIGILTVTTVASLLRTRGQSQEETPAGAAHDTAEAADSTSTPES